MVDPLRKIEAVGHLRIDETAEMDEDRGQEQQEEEDVFSTVQDKTDWKLLLDKSNLWKKNIQIDQEEVRQIYFRKVNLKTDPSLIRIEIELQGGEKIDPAFISLSRAQALSFKSVPKGQKLSWSQLTRDSFLRITVPSNPDLFRDETKKEALAELERKKKLENTEVTTVKAPIFPNEKKWGLKNRETGEWRWEWIVILGLLLLAVLITAGFFWLLI